MLFCYLISIIPLIIGGILWIKKKEINLWEWLAGGLSGFVLTGIFHLIAFHGMTADTETWSGEVTGATFYPYWMEYYTTTTTSTDADGNTTTTVHHHWVPHPEEWEVDTNIGSFNISQTKYNELRGKFGGRQDTHRAYKSNFHHGDPNIYQLVNTTSWIEPVTQPRHFTNRVKAAPTTFSYPKVTDTRVFEYPENEDRFVSDRLLGTANVINKREFDLLNSRLGPTKKVNIIMVGYPAGVGMDVAFQQEAKWIGGKKNDLVICFGGTTPSKPEWVKVFGWSESYEAKNNIETIVGTNGVSNKVLPLIEKEIMSNYTKKDWKKFDYISVPTPFWVYPSVILTMIATQIGLWLFFLNNDVRKEGGRYYGRYY